MVQHLLDLLHSICVHNDSYLSAMQADNENRSVNGVRNTLAVSFDSL
jgi:hypothetical protein